jgi:hypothetical protein
VQILFELGARSLCAPLGWREFKIFLLQRRHKHSLCPFKELALLLVRRARPTARATHPVHLLVG